MAWVPKWPVAGPVKTSDTFENGTWAPPVMQTCSVEGPLASKGAGFPLPVMLTGPVSTKPALVVAGLLAGQTVKSYVTSASVMVIWCVWGLRETGLSMFGLVGVPGFAAIHESGCSMVITAEKSALPESEFRSSDQAPCISQGPLTPVAGV